MTKSSRASWWRRTLAPLCAAALLLSPSISTASMSDTAQGDASVDATATPGHEVNAPRDLAPRITVGSHAGLSEAIDPAGEQDWFYFDAPAAGTYVVEVFDASSSFLPDLTVWSGTTLLKNDSPGDGSVVRRAAVEVSIPGRYDLRVDSYYSADRGTYSVRVLPQYDQGLTWATNGEPDGHRLLAAPVQIGRAHAVSRTIEHRPAHLRTATADVDWVYFHAPRAGAYTVETFDSAVLQVLTVYDRSGTQVASSGPGAGVVERSAEVDVAIPGDYFVRVTAYYGDDSGTYKLRVLPQYDQGHTWDATLEPNNSRMIGAPLTTGVMTASTNETRRSGTRDRADIDWFNVQLPAGNEAIVDLTPTGFYASLAVLDDSGTSVASRNCTAGKVCTVSFTPSIAGAFHVRVKPYYSDASGTYTLCARGAGQACSAVDPSKVTRLQGPDRYATAAAVSRQFPTGVATAFVANGTNFPDALAGAARAGTVDSPVLLTRAGSLPTATATELSRLRPQRIVVLGGTSAVSDSVLEALRAYPTSTASDAVIRIAGDDRYETAARVRALFPSGVATAYVATGHAFPDALSGAALAGAQGSPLLLVSTDRIPSPVLTELARLRPQRIVVLGGTTVVSDRVASALEQYTTATSGKVTRVSGSDRYGTSAAVAQRLPAGVDGAYVAAGTAFPDALSAAALAGSRTSPVLLTRAHALPTAVKVELTRLVPGHGYVVGGPAAVQDEVAVELAAYVR